MKGQSLLWVKIRKNVLDCRAKNVVKVKLNSFLPILTDKGQNTAVADDILNILFYFSKENKS